MGEKVMRVIEGTNGGYGDAGTQWDTGDEAHGGAVKIAQRTVNGIKLGYNVVTNPQREKSKHQATDAGQAWADVGKGALGVAASNAKGVKSNLTGGSKKD